MSLFLFELNDNNYYGNIDDGLGIMALDYEDRYYYDCGQNDAPQQFYLHYR